LKRLLAFVLALLAFGLAVAQGVLPVPELTARVIDQTGTLDAIQRKGLDEKLAAFEQKKGTQIVVLMVPTTQPRTSPATPNRVGNTWKIGRKEVGDGILVIVAKDDRKVRIEVAKTLEGAVPDLAAKMIIDDAITPKFRQGDFAGGLQAAVDQLIARVSGEALPAPKQPGAQQRGGGEGFDFFDLAILLFFAVPIVGGVLRGILGRKLGSVATGGGVGVLAMLFTSSLVVAAIAGVVGCCSRCCPAAAFGGGAAAMGRSSFPAAAGAAVAAGAGAAAAGRRLQLRRRRRFRRRRRLGRLVMGNGCNAS
jgi:uncharacterized protein